MTARSITKSSIIKFRQYLINNEKAELTIQKYIHEIEELSDFLGKEKLTKEQLLAYRDFLQKKHRVRTINAKLSAINSYLEFINIPQCRVKLLKVQHCAFVEESKELSEHEYKDLLQEAERIGNSRLYHIILTLCSTGIRVSELAYITVESLETGRVNICMKGKNRVVILQKQLVNRLRDYIQEAGIDSGVIFRTRTGKAIDRSNICHDMKKLSGRSGVEKDKIYPHNLRHLFAREYYKLDKDIAYLADILGHSSIETTRIYIAISAEEHEKKLSGMRLVT